MEVWKIVFLSKWQIFRFIFPGCVHSWCNLDLCNVIKLSILRQRCAIHTAFVEPRQLTASVAGHLWNLDTVNSNRFGQFGLGTVSGKSFKPLVFSSVAYTKVPVFMCFLWEEASLPATTGKRRKMSTPTKQPGHLFNPGHKFIELQNAIARCVNLLKELGLANSCVFRRGPKLKTKRGGRNWSNIRLRKRNPPAPGRCKGRVFREALATGQL